MYIDCVHDWYLPAPPPPPHWKLSISLHAHFTLPPLLETVRALQTRKLVGKRILICEMYSNEIRSLSTSNKLPRIVYRQGVGAARSPAFGNHPIQFHRGEPYHIRPWSLLNMPAARSATALHACADVVRVARSDGRTSWMIQSYYARGTDGVTRVSYGCYGCIMKIIISLEWIYYFNRCTPNVRYTTVYSTMEG